MFQRAENYTIDRRYNPSNSQWDGDYVAIILRDLDGNEVPLVTGAGKDDYIEVYHNAEFTYVVSYLPGFPYVVMRVFYTEDGDPIEECYLSNHDIPEGVDPQCPDPELLTPHLGPIL